MNNNQFKYSASMALHFEPYIIKDNAININNQNDKKFVEFIQSSSICVDYFSKLIDYTLNNDKISYKYLSDMMYDNVKHLNFRMWGAVEILYPAIISDIKNDYPFSGEFINVIKKTNNADVYNLNKSRKYKWSQSKKQYKLDYVDIKAINVYEHYERFKDKYNDNIMVTTWCNQILNGLPISKYIYEDIKYCGINDLEYDINIKWKIWIEMFSDFKIGQLADFLIVALYKYFRNNYIDCN